jgi:uncharacterized SAM-binding protein YcdF (DUF218 family)
MKRWPFIVILIAIVVFHRSIAVGLGQYLVVEDPVRATDAIYVLSGNPVDRAAEAARIFRSGQAKQVVCMGGETSAPLELYGIQDLTAEQTCRVLKDHEVPDSVIRLLPKGSSTFEEFEAIVEDCKKHGFQNVTIVSSRFHTRRIHAFFRNRLQFQGISMCLRGAKEHDFDEQAWWQKESGLMFVFNEFVKLGYYFLRH